MPVRLRPRPQCDAGNGGIGGRTQRKRTHIDCLTDADADGDDRRDETRHRHVHRVDIRRHVLEDERTAIAHAGIADYGAPDPKHDARTPDEPRFETIRQLNRAYDPTRPLLLDRRSRVERVVRGHLGAP